MKGKYRIVLMTLMLGMLLFLPSRQADAIGIGKAVILEPTSATMYTGDTQKLQMYVGGGPASASGWSSSKPSVATVSKAGVVTAKKAGTAVISCRTGFGYDLKCEITVGKRLEVSSYLNKSYKKLAKKAPETKYLNAAMDPAGIGTVYVFETSRGTEPFFRYDQKTKKISFLQLSTVGGDSRQNRYSLYGVSLGMTKKQAKAALKAEKCQYTGKQVNSGSTDLIYKKSGHKITVRIAQGKVSSLQWQR